MILEEWKPVVGTNGNYEVSESGQVRSLRFNKIRILKAGSSRGYKVVGVQIGKKQKMKRVHVLVAESFLDYSSKSKLVVHHKDKNKSNNHKSNLEAITQRKNVGASRTGKHSELLGVTKFEGSEKFISQITVKGKRRYLGSFDSEKLAHEAYKNVLV